MAYANHERALSALVAITTGLFLIGFQATPVSAQEMPPGVTVAAQAAFAPPDKLGPFQAMTFVIDIAPGAAFPTHSHPGKSQVIVLQGDLTQHSADGAKKVYHAGESFIEDVEALHSVSNDGSEPVRLVWTLLLPDGTQPIEVHTN